MKTKARTSIKDKINSNKNNKSQIENINKKNFCIFSRKKKRNEGRNEKKNPKTTSMVEHGHTPPIEKTLLSCSKCHHKRWCLAVGGARTCRQKS
jgi:hypothetical protein